MTTPSVDGLSGARADAPADALTGELIAAENAHLPSRTTTTRCRW